MTSPNLTAQNSPSSGYFSAGTTLAGSAQSQPKCTLCLDIWKELYSPDMDVTWPPMKDLKKPCHGWPALAKLMYKNPGFESFPAFRDLHIKSLLYYQAKLDDIRQELHKLEWQDHNSETFEDHEVLSKNVGFLFMAEANPTAGVEGVEGDGDRKQMLLIGEMRKVLKEYSEALLLYTKISDLPKPEAFRAKSILEWLRRKKYPIEGAGANSWGTLLQQRKERPSISSQFFRLVRTVFWSMESDDDLDLVVPLTNKSADGLTKWIESEGVPFWERVREALHERREHILPRTRASTSSKCDPNASDTTLTDNGLRGEEKIQIITYRFKTLLAFTTFITTVFASLLPIVAIVVLSKLHTQPMILGFIALFTGLFTMGLMMLTPSSTKRTEIFTASAAFAAVMVVFVQNQTGGNGS